MSQIAIRGLKKSYGQNVVLDGIDLDVEQGEAISIIGPSGCGKSTFLRCLNLLDPPQAGSIHIDGVDYLSRDADVRELRRKMGMVFQSYSLFPHLLVVENIMLAPTRLLHIPRQEAYEHALELLQMVGLGDKALVLPDELSGGQRQRVAIARALAMDPQILLFDEPTSALDPMMVSEVLATIRMLAKREMTMLIVTHEMSFAREVASRVLYFDEKGIYEQGTPSQIFDSPTRPKTIAFIRKLKFLEFHVDAAGFDLMRLQAAIHGFAERYGIGDKRDRLLQLCAEELVMEVRAAKISCAEKPELDIEVEYSETDSSVRLSCIYSGRRFNPFDIPDIDIAADMSEVGTSSTPAAKGWSDPGVAHLGVTILRNIAKSIDFSFNPQQATEGGPEDRTGTNRLTVCL